MSGDNLIIGNIESGGTTPRQERRDAAANRALILQTAEKLFASGGVENVSMADIALAAGVGKGTLYRRFGNKGELCLALMDSQMAEFQNSMLTRMQQLNMANKPKLELLDQFLDALVYFTEIHSPLLCVVQREGSLQEMDSTTLQMPHMWQFMTVNGLLREAQKAGELASDVDTDYLADALLASLKVDIFRFQRQTRGFSLERISAGLRQIVAGLAQG